MEEGRQAPVSNQDDTSTCVCHALAKVVIEGNFLQQISRFNHLNSYAGLHDLGIDGDPEELIKHLIQPDTHPKAKV